jgi:hypothetical protein
MVSVKPKAKPIGKKTVAKVNKDKKTVKVAKRRVSSKKPKAVKASNPKIVKKIKQEEPEKNKPVASWNCVDYLLEAISTLSSKRWVPYLKITKFLNTYTPYAVAANPLVQADSALKHLLKIHVATFRRGGRFWALTKKGQAWRHEKAAKLTEQK